MTYYARVGPLHVQRPLYPERDGTVHIYCVHPPGGMAQGDRLAVRIGVQQGGRALVTTPGATKFYRTPDGQAVQSVDLSVDDGCSLEWMPQSSIVFDGAHARSDIKARVSPAGRVIIRDIVCLGAPTIDRPFNAGSWSSAIELWVDDVPVHVERSLIPGRQESPHLDARWGLNGRSVLGTLVAYAPEGVSDDVMAEMAEQLGDSETAGVTRIGKVVVCRCVGHRALEVTESLTLVWQILRPAVLSKPVVLPRVWAA